MPVGSGQEVEDNGEKKMNKEIPFCKMAIYPAHTLRLQNFRPFVNNRAEMGKPQEMHGAQNYL